MGLLSGIVDKAKKVYKSADSIAGSNIFGIASSAFGAMQQNAANSKEAQKNRDFQEYMSSTAHQREVTDLRAAGLNPILSATGGSGASSPSGSMARMENTGKDVASNISKTSLLQAQLSQLNSATNLNEENAAETAARRALIEMDVKTFTGNEYARLVKAVGIEAALGIMAKDYLLKSRNTNAAGTTVTRLHTPPNSRRRGAQPKTAPGKKKTPYKHRTRRSIRGQ